ncbi:MAG: hypothetical protein WDW36_000527 [Sanguina aurantia]
MSAQKELKPPADLVRAIHESEDMTAPATHGPDYSINTPHAIRAKLEHEQPLAKTAADPAAAAADGAADHEKEVRHAHDKEVAHTHRRGAANKADPTQSAGTNSGRESYKSSHHGAHETSSAMPRHQ